MDITPVIPKGRQVISRYGNGGFLIGETAHKGNILVLPDRTLPWDAHALQDAAPESFRPLLAAEPPPEIVIIGAGSAFAPLPPALRAFFRERKIAAEVMDTGAACRTYNVLAGEDRHVAAALIAV